MEHRRVLAQPQAQRGFRGDGLYARIGGQATVAALVDGLYDRIELDGPLRRLFGRRLERERDAQKRFFTEWLGGDAMYSDSAYMPLLHRHDLVPITRELADRWLGHFRAALEQAVGDAAATDEIYQRVELLARAFVNEGEQPTNLRVRSHGVCLRYLPAIEAHALARSGDVFGLSTLLDRAPDVLASRVQAAALLHVAALGGRTGVVEMLLERGVDVNAPTAIEPLIFVTPLCAARLGGRGAVEAMLLQWGAREDVFTYAFLGDLQKLHEDLEHEPALAQATDPAVDALDITPVHHAVAGGRVEALRMLLGSVQGPIRTGGRAVRQAAMRDDVTMVELLIEHGADARSLGAGRWVLHPELARLLVDAGASVGHAGEWIGLSCTGNQGRKDDPAFVEALLRYGARVDDRRLVGQDNDAGRATALHYAAKAGFLRTIELLLARGADPDARDDNGLTPLHWLARSAKSVDRDAVRRLLQRARGTG